MPIHVLLDVVEHLDMIVELVANLDAQLPLPADAVTQPIQLLVLIPEHVLVVLVDLLVVQLALVRRGPAVLGFVPIWEQRGAVGVVLFIRCGSSGARVVGKADGFGRVGRVRVGTLEKRGRGGIPGSNVLGTCKVRRQSRVVWLRSHQRGGRFGGEAAELGR